MPLGDLPVVRIKDLMKTPAMRAVEAVMNTVARELCEDAGVVMPEPSQPGETDTRSNLAPRRRVELD